MQFELHKFLLTLEKDFPEILNEVLSCRSDQQQQTNSKENRNTPNQMKIGNSTILQ